MAFAGFVDPSADELEDELDEDESDLDEEVEDESDEDDVEEPDEDESFCAGGTVAVLSFRESVR